MCLIKSLQFFITVQTLIITLFIKELANEFEQKFECLGENTEKNKTFSDTIEKEVTEINKGGNESVVTISYKIKFFDSARIMATSLSNSVH